MYRVAQWQRGPRSWNTPGHKAYSRMWAVQSNVLQKKASDPGCKAERAFGMDRHPDVG